MIRESIDTDAQSNLLIEPMVDAPYLPNAWVRWVQQVVEKNLHDHGLNNDLVNGRAKIGLIGESRQGSGYYPELFSNWPAPSVATQTDSHQQPLSAKPVREALLEKTPQENAQGAAYLSTEHARVYLPEAVREMLHRILPTPEWQQVVAEQRFVTEYQQAWEKAPYPPNFVTTDALVVYRGQLLLIERKRLPGKGLLAFPGGFVDPTERLLSACIRELLEETQIQLDKATLLGAIKQQQLFDDPYRSARGRTLTQATLFDLSHLPERPRVKAADDAADAQWVPLAQIRPLNMFEDHYGIAQAMLGIE